MVLKLRKHHLHLWYSRCRFSWWTATLRVDHYKRSSIDFLLRQTDSFKFVFSEHIFENNILLQFPCGSMSGHITVVISLLQREFCSGLHQETCCEQLGLLSQCSRAACDPHSTKMKPSNHPHPQINPALTISLYIFMICFNIILRIMRRLWLRLGACKGLLWTR